MQNRIDLPSGTVTLMFTDVEGSTELLHELGDQAYSQVIGAHHRLLRDVFDKESGAVVDIEGDAFFVAFPRAWSAVSAAVAAQHALAAYPWPHGRPLRIRMGIHTGEPLLTEHNYVGLDVHRAARIGASGHGGQVVLSERTLALAREALPEGVTVKDLGEHRFKGIPHPEHMFQLVIPGLPEEFPRLKSLDVVTNNLPQQLTSFIGRDREVAEVTMLLGKARMVTLTGPGGTGKTRLSVQVATDLLSDFPRGVWQVELAPISDPALIPQAVASALGLRELPGRPLLDLIVDYLRSKKVLILLDNCEHVVGAAAQLAYALLKACPNLHILATSREGLGVPGEMISRVPPLRRPDPRARFRIEELREFESIRLFVDRATAGSPAFVLSEANAPAVRQIVNQLDGIPLAIELAAARVKTLPVEKIATRLEDRFKLLVGGARAGLTHHQTLRATMDWSFDLLSQAERILLQRLSVFAGSFTLEAAESICSGNGVELEDVLDLLGRLVDKSLVVTEGTNGDVRYYMLETVRQYSAEKLTQSGEEQPVRERHLGWYLVIAESEERRLWGPDQAAALDVLERELGNLRAALEWTIEGPGDGEQGLHLAAALGRFWLMHGYLTEGRRWLDGALAKSATATTQARAKSMYGAAALASEKGDYDPAAQLTEETLALYRALGEASGVALSLNLQGYLARQRGDFDRGFDLLKESMEVSRPARLSWSLAEALNTSSVIATSRGDYDQAKTLGTESLALWRELGDKRGLAEALNILGTIAQHQGDYERAAILKEEALALAREIGDRLTLSRLLTSLGAVRIDQGNNDRAAELLEESLILSRDLGSKRGAAAALGNLGVVAYQRGAYEQARGYLNDAKEIWTALGASAPMATWYHIMGKISLAEGNRSAARELHQESLRRFQNLGDRLGIAEALAGLARVALAEGDPGEAARLLGAATELRESLGFPLPPAERTGHRELLNSLEAALGEEAFAEACRQGESMSSDEAVERAFRMTAANPPSD